MPQEQEQIDSKHNTIDWRELVQVVLKEWKIVLISVGVFLLLANINLHMNPSVFAVQMVVTPVQGSNDQVSSRMNSLSSLAQLAGLNLSPSAGQSASQFRAYLDSMYSRDLSNELAKNDEIMHAIFHREWDAKAQRWKKPSPNVIEIIRGVFMRVLGARPLPWTPPNGARLQEFLTGPGGIIVMQDVKRPDLATIEMDSANPKFAIKLLNAINQAADNRLRKKALRRATQYINYLSKELDTVTVAEHRAAIVQALSEQEKFKMSASSATPYGADLADAPWASLTRLAPRPSKEYPKAIGEGLLVGALIALLLHYFGDYIRERTRRYLPVERLPQSVRQRLKL